MAVLLRLYVVLTTDREVAANSDSRMRLVFDNGQSEEEFELGGQRHDERELGRTDLYEFDVRQAVDMDDILPTQFKIVAAGTDAWLPSSIFVIGTDRDGAFEVLVGVEPWPSEGWFSTQSSDAKGRAEKARILDSSGTPTTS